MVLFWFCMAVMSVVLTIGGAYAVLMWFADLAESECAKRRHDASRKI